MKPKKEIDSIWSLLVNASSNFKIFSKFSIDFFDLVFIRFGKIASRSVLIFLKVTWWSAVVCEDRLWAAIFWVKAAGSIVFPVLITFQEFYWRRNSQEPDKPELRHFDWTLCRRTLKCVYSTAQFFSPRFKRKFKKFLLNEKSYKVDLNQILLWYSRHAETINRSIHFRFALKFFSRQLK